MQECAMSTVREQRRSHEGSARRTPGANGFAICAMLAVLLCAGPALGTTIESLLEPFTGGHASVLVTISDEDASLDDGELLVTVEVLDGGAIRGVFLDLSDDSLLGGIVAEGDYVTDVETGNVINLGGGSNLHGGGSPCPCDLGVEIGTPGGSRDFVQSTSFTLSSSYGDLDISLFFDQNVGVRLSPRNSSKLGGVLPVPEPSSAALLGLGVIGLALRRKLRS
jgi:hypothetical protein